MIDIKVIKNFLICSAGGLILKFISSLIVLISISFIEPEQYGLLSLFNTFIAIFPILLNLGLRQAFGLDFFHTTNYERKKMLNDIISIYLTISLPILLLSLLNLKLIDKYIFLNKAGSNILLIILIICFMHFFVELFFQTLRYQLKILELSIFQILMSFIYAIVSIFLLYFSNLKVVGILFATFISNLFIMICALHLYIKKVNFFKFNIFQNKKKSLYYLKLGFPFVPSIFFNWLISFGDRWILIRYTTLDNIGIYSLADSFGQLYQLLILTPLLSSYVPYIFEKFSKEREGILEIDKWNQKNMWVSMLAMFIIISVGFFAVKNFLYWILPEKYFRSINFIWLILIEQTVFLGSHFATCYLVFFKKSYILAGLVIFSSVLNLILNILLIPVFSIDGCIFATIISYIVYLISILIFTNYVKKQQNINEISLLVSEQKL